MVDFNVIQMPEPKIPTREDYSGDYPIIVSIPDTIFFARETVEDEGYEYPWVVINSATGEHLVEGTVNAARRWVSLLAATELRQ